jgi:hypothetical protein
MREKRVTLKDQPACSLGKSANVVTLQIEPFPEHRSQNSHLPPPVSARAKLRFMPAFRSPAQFVSAAKRSSCQMLTEQGPRPRIPLGWLARSWQQPKKPALTFSAQDPTC